MIRRLLVVLALAAPLGASSRWLTDRAGAPVKWEPWGTAAIARAQKQNRPIFLSIGFAASWECERMMRGAFQDPAIATTLNDGYVPVLLDRIEYPEVARAYETFAGATEWPLNLILAPTLEPIATGGAMETPELRGMLLSNANRWATERNAVLAAARAKLARPAAPRAVTDVDATTIESTVDAIAKTYDADHQNFRGEPHTHHAATLAFLLRYADRTKYANILELTNGALLRLARTPVRDQLGGGFHRATRDAAFTDPYFEKLLVDQAWLALVYLDAWQLTGEPEYEQVARSTLDYMLRDLRGTAFDSSQYAHSLVPSKDGPQLVQGVFYRWDPDEIRRLVGETEAKKLIDLFGVGPLPARKRAIEPALNDVVAKVSDARQKRPEPFRDFNVIAGWNGLAIAALARGGAVFGDTRYTEGATSVARVVMKTLWNAQTKTLRRAENVDALAEDYAMLVRGMLELFNAGHDVAFLDLAIALQQRQDALFWDASSGRYVTGASVPEPMRAWFTETDLETPSANALSVPNLLRLSALTGNETWRERPAMIFVSFSSRLRADGASVAQLASSYEDSLRECPVVVVTGDERRKETHDLLAASQQRFEPLRTVVFLPLNGPARVRVTRALPFTSGLAGEPKQAILYVCRKDGCGRQ